MGNELAFTNSLNITSYKITTKHRNEDHLKLTLGRWRNIIKLMKTTDLISAKEIRQDLIGFLRRVKSGRPLTVIYRSKPFVTLNDDNTPLSSIGQLPGSPEAVSKSLAYAKRLRSGRKPVLDPAKSIKELYAESMDEKYGIVR